MSHFLDAILAFPTVFFTILLGVTLTYWMFVILGAVGVDVLDGDVDVTAGAKAASGMLEGGAKAAGGVLEGGAKAAGGMFEGGAKALSGALDGALDGASEAGAQAADGAHAADGHGAEADGGLFEALGFAGVPVTVSASFVVFFSWTLSLLINEPVDGLLGALVPGFLLAGAVGLLSLLVGVLCASVAVRPLRRVFIAHHAPGRDSLMGRVCIISSGSVTDRFGHATFADGGAGLILNVYCARPNGLKRGDQALLLGYDAARDVYEVEPVDWLLPEETQQLGDPLRAEAIARARSRVR